MQVTVSKADRKFGVSARSESTEPQFWLLTPCGGKLNVSGTGPTNDPKHFYCQPARRVAALQRRGGLPAKCKVMPFIPRGEA